MPTHDRRAVMTVNTNERERRLEALVAACKAHLDLMDLAFMAKVMLTHGERFCDAYNFEHATWPTDTSEREAAGLMLRLCRRVDSEARHVS